MVAGDGAKPIMSGLLVTWQLEMLAFGPWLGDGSAHVFYSRCSPASFCLFLLTILHYLERGSAYGAQAGLKCVTLLPPCPES